MFNLSPFKTHCRKPAASEPEGRLRVVFFFIRLPQLLFQW